MNTKDDATPTALRIWNWPLGRVYVLAFLHPSRGHPFCLSRRYLLGSLYCAVGHSDRSDPRIRETVTTAEQSGQLWLTTWARRVREITEQPEAFHRQDWCGWPGHAAHPAG